MAVFVAALVGHASADGLAPSNDQTVRRCGGAEQGLVTNNKDCVRITGYIAAAREGAGDKPAERHALFEAPRSVTSIGASGQPPLGAPNKDSFFLNVSHDDFTR